MSSQINRPTPREVFLTKERLLPIYFYTSNIAKFLQARVVFERAGLTLHHFRSKEDPYSEDYSAGKRALLERAIQQILSSVGSGSLFFVEDTSLRIEALSTGLEDFPGLTVKEWFAQTSFDELNAQLLNAGNDRQAEIKSDIALHVPGLPRSVHFHGNSKGAVADSRPTFQENPHYPWLTPASFNGWFIPKGSDRRLGEMSLEESWAHDFRIRSLEDLITRLEEYTAAVNSPGQIYARRTTAETSGQLLLLPPESPGPVLIVVGHTCAGKTTFGEWSRAAHNLHFIEASSILRMVQQKVGIDGTDAYAIAKRTLTEYGPDVVARKILELYHSELRRGVAITGFRTIEEVEVIRKELPNAKVVLIEASDRTRFQRHLERGRNEEIRTMQDFRVLDERHWSFGLLRVAEEFADIRILNEGPLGEFQKQVDAVVANPETPCFPGISVNIKPRHGENENQLYRCLTALQLAGHPLTCEEIEEITRRSGKPILHNNANKVLKKVPELVKRLEIEGSRLRYEILAPGRAYTRLLGEWSKRQRTVAT